MSIWSNPLGKRHNAKRSEKLLMSCTIALQWPNSRQIDWSNIIIQTKHLRGCGLRFHNAKRSLCVFVHRIWVVATFLFDIWYSNIMSIMACSRHLILTIDWWLRWILWWEISVKIYILTKLISDSSLRFAGTSNFIVWLSYSIWLVFTAFSIDFEPGSNCLHNLKFFNCWFFNISATIDLDVIVWKRANTAFGQCQLAG
jgi:hypothetical protein